LHFAQVILLVVNPGFTCAFKQALLATNSTKANLKQALFMQFKGRVPTIGEAPTALNITPCNLQRKLLQEQATFRDIAAEIRKDIAFQLMQNRR